MKETTKRERAAVAYTAAVKVGSESPTKHVADALGISRTAAAKLVAAARCDGLLAPTTQGRHGGQPQAVAGHNPARARWTSGESWWACQTCRQPWPCGAARASG